MRRTRHTTPETRRAFVRSILSAALLLCVLSGVLPAEAALSPKGLMACCRAKGMSMAAGRADSCPLCRRARPKAPKTVRHDPVCGADRALRANVNAAHATLVPSQSARRRAQRRVGLEQKLGVRVWPSSIPRTDSGQSSVEVASLSRPCPQGCCGTTASSFAGLRRQRQAAALAESYRPRPPAVESNSYAHSGVIKFTCALRRAHPPRAPPAGLNIHSA